MLFFGHPFDGFASESSRVVVVLGGKERKAVTFLDGLSFFFLLLLILYLGDWRSDKMKVGVH